MIRQVYLLAEGAGDLGNHGAPVVWGPAQEGALQPLVRRGLPLHEVEFVPTGPMQQYVDAPTDVKGKDEARAKQAVVLAEAMGWHLVVMHADADARSDSDGRAPKSFAARRNAMLKGAREAASKAVGFVAAVPVRMTETWLLADQKAVKAQRHDGQFAAKPPDKLGRPEQLGGAPGDPDSDYPKAVLERLLGEPASRALQADIAEDVDLDQLERLCPVSFKPFRDDLEAAQRYWSL